MGTERRRRRLRRSSSADSPADSSAGSVADPAAGPPRPPTPNDIAEMGGTFAMTAGVHDPDEGQPEDSRGEAPARDAGYERPAVEDAVVTERNADAVVAEAVVAERSGEVVVAERSGDDQQTERGLRGLVGGGSSQVSVGSAMRARDAARPTDEDLAAADRDLVIVRRGWVPREDLPPRIPRR